MDRGLRQEDLAQLLGLSVTAISHWERDLNKPYVRHWPDLEAHLGSGLVPVEDQVGSRLRAARLRLGLSMEEVGKRAGLDLRTVGNAERGRYRPCQETRRRLEDVVGDLG